MSYNVETLKVGDIALLKRVSRNGITDVALCIVINDSRNIRRFLPIFSNYCDSRGIFPCMNEYAFNRGNLFTVQYFGDKSSSERHMGEYTIKKSICAYKKFKTDIDRVEFLLNAENSLFKPLKNEFLNVRNLSNRELINQRIYKELLKRVDWDVYLEDEEDLFVKVPKKTFATLISLVLNEIPDGAELSLKKLIDIEKIFNDE